MARILDQLLGHNRIVQGFLTGLESGHLASSFLFVGPHGVGKALAAKAFAQALLCERQRSGACGLCPSCLRVEAGSSEALVEVFPENGQIRVDSSRQIIRRLSLKTSGKAQVVIIHQSHLMNPQAANALLKMIEEPPEACYFFLLAPTTSSLLATIRSRCQIFHFSPLSLEVMKQLSNQDEWILRASRGSMDRLQTMQGDELQDLRKLASRVLWWGLYDEASFFENDWRKNLKDRDKTQLLIQVLTGFLRDALLVSQGGDDILNGDYSELIAGVAKHPGIAGLCGRVAELERDIRGNVEAQLAFEAFFFRSEERLEQSQ